MEQIELDTIVINDNKEVRVFLSPTSHRLILSYAEKKEIKGTHEGRVAVKNYSKDFSWVSDFLNKDLIFYTLCNQATESNCKEMLFILYTQYKKVIEQAE